jgi:hypothetical protein
VYQAGGAPVTIAGHVASNLVARCTSWHSTCEDRNTNAITRVERDVQMARSFPDGPEQPLALRL